jgi:hypothetical protein
MKNILLLSLMLFLCISISFSQFGIKGGINLATIGGADKSLQGVDPTAKTGFTAGISYKIGLILGLSIQPEALYTQKGALYENPLGKITFSMNYIDIPVLAKFNLPVPLLSPYIEGGVSYSILLSAKEKTEYTALGGNLPTAETDVKDLLTKNDVSIIVGVGVELLILDINARYVIGQTKLFKDSDAKVYNRGFVFTAGLRF